MATIYTQLKFSSARQQSNFQQTLPQSVFVHPIHVSAHCSCHCPAKSALVRNHKFSQQRKQTSLNDRNSRNLGAKPFSQHRCYIFSGQSRSSSSTAQCRTESSVGIARFRLNKVTGSSGSLFLCHSPFHCLSASFSRKLGVWLRSRSSAYKSINPGICTPFGRSHHWCIGASAPTAVVGTRTKTHNSHRV